MNFLLNNPFRVSINRFTVIKYERTERNESMEKKILVVDDEKPIADILQFNLKKEGYDVNCAYDGNEALEMVEEIKPDLILLDIMLPQRMEWKFAVKFVKNMKCQLLC